LRKNLRKFSAKEFSKSDESFRLYEFFKFQDRENRKINFPGKWWAGKFFFWCGKFFGGVRNFLRFFLDFLNASKKRGQSDGRTDRKLHFNIYI
jgi:hypothetical protein